MVSEPSKGCLETSLILTFLWQVISSWAEKVAVEGNSINILQ